MRVAAAAVVNVAVDRGDSVLAPQKAKPQPEVLIMAALAGLLAVTIVGMFLLVPTQSSPPLPPPMDDLGRVPAIATGSLDLPDSLTLIRERGDERGKRWLLCRYSGPTDAETVRETLRPIYEFYKADIEAKQPDDRWKAIRIAIAACDTEAEHGLPFAVCESAPGPTVATWDKAKVTIEKRDRETQLTSHEEMIYSALIGFSRKAGEEADAPYRDAKGMINIPKSDVLLNVANRDRAEDRLRAEFVESTGISDLEIERVSVKWAIWSAGKPATDDAVNTALKERIKSNQSAK